MRAVKKSDKLLRFTLDDGSGTDRQILSGIAMYYKPEELVGKTLVAIVNLPPRKMMGQESCGMLLSAVHTEHGEEQAPPGHAGRQLSPPAPSCAERILYKRRGRACVCRRAPLLSLYPLSRRSRRRKLQVDGHGPPRGQ